MLCSHDDLLCCSAGSVLKQILTHMLIFRELTILLIWLAEPDRRIELIKAPVIVAPLSKTQVRHESIRNPFYLLYAESQVLMLCHLSGSPKGFARE